MKSRALLFVLFFAWPAVLVNDSGPSMADSVLLGAIRLVDHHTLSLSDELDANEAFKTLAHDISVRDGRIHSGVGPGASVAAAPFYALFRPTFAAFDGDVITNRRILNYYAQNARALEKPPAPHFKDLYLLQILLVVTLVAPLFAGFLVRLRNVLIDRGSEHSQATLVALATGLGTMALYYSSMLSRQALGYLLLWHALLWLVGPRTPGRATCCVIGLLCGAAIAIEYPCALLIGLALPVLARRLSWQQWLLIALPLLSLVGLLALYHQAAFGSPFATPYHYRYWYTDPLLVERGIDLGAFQPSASLGMNAPSASVMLSLCFGSFKGLFLYSPILLLGLIGHCIGLRRGPNRSLHGLSLLVFVAYLVYNSTLGTHLPEYGHHFWGGLSVLWGPRYLFAVLPFLAWGLIRLDWSQRSTRVVCGIALALSVAHSLLGTMYSHVIMSTFTFGDELRYPIAYVYTLLLERGPRIALLDRHDVAPLVQSFVLLALFGLTAFILHRDQRDAADMSEAAG